MQIWPNRPWLSSPTRAVIMRPQWRRDERRDTESFNALSGSPVAQKLSEQDYITCRRQAWAPRAQRALLV